MRTRRIFLSHLVVESPIGILDYELSARQALHIDAEFELRESRPTEQDDIEEVLDYRCLREAIIDECTRAHVNLLETLTDQLVNRLLREFPQVSKLRIRVGKPMAFSDCDAVGIEVEASQSL